MSVAEQRVFKHACFDVFENIPLRLFLHLLCESALQVDLVDIAAT